MNIILVLIVVFACLFHGCTGGKANLRQINSPEVIKTAKQFQESIGKLRGREIETFIEYFLQTHIQKPGEVIRLDKPIIKNRISKENLIKLLGPPDSQNENGTMIFYDLGSTKTSSSSGIICFKNDYLVDFYIMKKW